MLLDCSFVPRISSPDEYLANLLHECLLLCRRESLRCLNCTVVFVTTNVTYYTADDSAEHCSDGAEYYAAAYGAGAGVEAGFYGTTCDERSEERSDELVKMFSMRGA